MHELELVCGQQSIRTTLSKTPRQLTARALAAIAVSVKADGFYRLRVDTAALGLLCPEMQENAARAWSINVRVNGEVVSTYSSTLDGVVTLTPVTDAAGSRGRIFEHCIGTVVLALEIHIAGQRVMLFSEPFFVAIPVGQIADYVQAMSRFVVDRLSLWGSPGTVDSRTLDAPETLQKRLEGRLHHIHQTLKRIEQAYPYLYTNARFRLVSQARIGSVGQLTGFSQTTLRHIIEHPEELEPSRHGRGIKVQGRFYMPRRTLVETKAKSFDLPENCQVLGFVEHVCAVLQQEAESVDEQLKKLPGRIVVEAGYISSGEAVMGEVQRRLEGYRSDVQMLLDLALKLVTQYRQILPVQPALFSGVPQPTRLFLTVPAYRLIYSCMNDWQEKHSAPLVDESLLMSAFERSRLYEVFCLFKLLDALLEAGFVCVKRSRFEYSLRTRFFEQGPLPNTFAFERRAADGSLEAKATVFYEPVIAAPAADSANGVDLVRTTPLSWDGEHVKRVDNAKSFITPDFVVRFEKAGRVVWTVADAKYTDGWNAVESCTRELLFKYLFGVSPVKGGEKLGDLWLFYAWANERDSRGVVPENARSWAENGTDVRYALISPEDNSARRFVQSACGA